MKWIFTITVYILVNLLWGCNQMPKSVNNIDSNILSSKSITGEEILYTYKVYPVKNGWGYDIFRKDKLYIHQPFVPAVQGKVGFSNEFKAETTALLVIQKLKNGIIPPEISIQELDSLKVIE